ncbi:hypothetical protein B6N58_11865 [Legionella micdadei]|uniref:Uncharacterized protein n=2 Tax=Legionella micdadei TaxID=451 RepID=A0A098GDD3_LEGMI|nr:hypothetical protein [Legionella micdadei]ARG98301.1 hypothetical protein B6N58_11865 [Legionella micdadei]KTD27231.1 hypothetical protein Lmic_2166 [Legionella micdadei]CEG60030.1 protein of unknown function [Legionella micdadei]SCY61934.1 hypothetical protein SAMN02982997_02266 [Legionella micdadei]
MGGGIWKHGNSVIFYHNTYQVVVLKSMFSSTETAKKLKINTIGYARKIFEKKLLDNDEKEELIKKICACRDILKIDDIKIVPGFPQGEFEDQEIINFVSQEKQILEEEKK